MRRETAGEEPRDEGALRRRSADLCMVGLVRRRKGYTRGQLCVYAVKYRGRCMNADYSSTRALLLSSKMPQNICPRVFATPAGRSASSGKTLK